MPGPLTAQYPTLAPRTAQVWSVPKPKKKPLPIFESVVAGAGAALMIVGVLGFLQASGPVLTVFLAILCIVPLAIVVSLLLFIDRFDPSLGDEACRASVGRRCVSLLRDHGK